MKKVHSILENFINEVKLNKRGKLYRREGKKGFKRRYYEIKHEDITEKDIKRFFSFIKIQEDEKFDTPHMIFTGWHAKYPKKNMPFSDKKKYGMFSFKGKRKKSVDVRAIRFAHVLFYKKEIPPDKTVNHICGESSCVSPLHSYVGTPEENIADRYKASERPPAEKLIKYKKRIMKLIGKYKKYIKK